ncbi:hypothetical protein AB0F77_38810 [Streptomyces sp. NPDC026672]|uniref:hypothetical protein n=1 Tax=unclassified Streptomyces TaxID=2593676 RepID=UPI0033FDF67A
MPAATLAADLDARLRLLLLRDEPALAAARAGDDPQEALPPARLTTYARRRTLRHDHT